MQHMIRVFLAVACSVLLLSGRLPELQAQETAATTTPQRYPIQEGFPLAQLQRLKNRASSLQSQLGADHAQVAQGVILVSERWNMRSEMPVKVAFLGGTSDLRARIAAAAQAWGAITGVRFDFGPSGSFYEWTRHDQTYAAQVRIVFDESGLWSLVGAQSIDPSLSGPAEASLSLQGFDQQLPDDWQGTVLHEFGHAIGFEHEHQNPSADCASQFRWENDPGYTPTNDIYGQFVQDSAGRRPGIYTVLGGPPNNWPKDKIDDNLRSLPNTLDLRYTVFDPKSVMIYSFADWMYVGGDKSSCYTPENQTLSELDQQIAAQEYPLSPVSGVDPSGGIDLAASQKLLRNKKLPTDVNAHLRDRVAAYQTPR